MLASRVLRLMTAVMVGYSRAPGFESTQGLG